MGRVVSKMIGTILPPWSKGTDAKFYALSDLCQDICTMMEKYFVEDCDKLPIGKIKTTKEIKELASREVMLKGGLKIRYKERLSEGIRFLDIVYCLGGSWFTQSIEIEAGLAKYGLRRYWLCRCGRRCSKLYLRRDRPVAFGCRNCLNLKYNLSYLNRNTKAGRILSQAHWLNKTMELQEKIHSITYGNRGTRKAISFLLAARRLQRIP